MVQLRSGGLARQPSERAGRMWRGVPPHGPSTDHFVRLLACAPTLAVVRLSELPPSRYVL